MRKPMSELRADAELKFPDNTTGEISPADLRSWALDFLDSMTPGYGILTLDTPGAMQTFTTTPSIVTAYDTPFLATEPFTADPATGIFTAVGSVVADLSVNASVQFAQGRELLLKLYKNGTAVPYAVESNGEGLGSPINMFASGIVEVAPGDTLDVRGSMDGGAGTDVTFAELVFIARAVPLRDTPTP